MTNSPRHELGKRDATHNNGLVEIYLMLDLRSVYNFTHKVCHSSRPRSIQTKCHCLTHNVLSRTKYSGQQVYSIMIIQSNNMKVHLGTSIAS